MPHHAQAYTVTRHCIQIDAAWNKAARLMYRAASLSKPLRPTDLWMRAHDAATATLPTGDACNWRAASALITDGKVPQRLLLCCPHQVDPGVYPWMCSHALCRHNSPTHRKVETLDFVKGKPGNRDLSTFTRQTQTEKQSGQPPPQICRPHLLA